MAEAGCSAIVGRLGEAGRRVIYDDDFVRRTATEIAETLDDVAWGRLSWQDVCRHLGETLAGSASSIVNYDLAEDTINAGFAHGIGPAYLASYHSHFMGVNPWLEFWGTAPAGAVRISERDYPARSFRNSEFYTDWLAPQKNMEAAVGLRIDVDPHNMIHLTWHYDVARAEAYDAVAASIATKLVPSISQVVRVASMVRDALRHEHMFGPLIERIDGAALVLDRERRIREANAEAIAWLRVGDPLASVGDILNARHPAAQKWLEETVARLADRELVATPEATIRIDERIVRLAAARIPGAAAGGAASLMPTRPAVLVVARLLVGGRRGLDHAGLRFAYGLSTAELRLCEFLVEGCSLAEAAAMLGVSDGTVRQRVKLIFHKTRTHRQGELIALLARFAA